MCFVMANSYYLKYVFIPHIANMLSKQLKKDMNKNNTLLLSTLYFLLKFGYVLWIISLMQMQIFSKF